METLLHFIDLVDHGMPTLCRGNTSQKHGVRRGLVLIRFYRLRLWGNNTASLGHNKTRKDKKSISICYVLARANDLERLLFGYPSGSGGGQRQNEVPNKFQVLLQLRGHLWKTHAKLMAQHNTFNPRGQTTQPEASKSENERPQK